MITQKIAGEFVISLRIVQNHVIIVQLNFKGMPL